LGSLADATLIKGDLPAQSLYLGGPQGVGRTGVDSNEQSECSVKCSCVTLRTTSGEQAPRPASGFGSQHCSAL
jgi:hypothetical protein